MTSPESDNLPTPVPSLQRLLATWQAWNSRDVLAQAAHRAHTAGDTERAAALHFLLDADGQPAGPSATEALAAQHELATRLAGWRWQTVAAARAEGATWRDIAAATGATAEHARTEYAMDLECAEQAATAAGIAFDHDRYRGPLTDEPDDELDRAIASTEEPPMTDRAHDDSNTHGENASTEAYRLPTPDLALPVGQLTDRELIARAEHYDEIAHTGSPSDQAAARRDLDAAWTEAERRADGHPAVSIPAQVAGYIGLVREDYDHALAAETTTWRRELDHALRPLEIEDLGPREDIPTAHVLTANEASADPEGAWQRSGGWDLTLEERADRAQSLAQGAGVDVAGFDPNTDVYTDPDTGQVVRLDGRASEAAPPAFVDGDAARGVEATGDWDAASAIAERDGHVAFDPAEPGGFRALTADERRALTDQVSATQPATWAAAQHEAYLDSRPDETTAYNPAADYGEPDWREPASDAEAAARTAWLDEHTAPTPGWRPRPLTEVETAWQDAQERAVLSDRAHDSDPYAWAEARRLEALTDLAPLPARDALDDLPRDEQGQPDTLARREWNDDAAGNGGADNSDAPFTDTQGRWWQSTGAWAAGTCDPARDHDDDQLEAPDDPQRLNRRMHDLRATLAARDTNAEGEGEQRREQLARWHENDHRTPDAAEVQGVEIVDNGADESGWGR
ncbi:hypothetical protein ACFPK1_00945 [Actinomycetospora rhizophila]|uniref:Uncharacterized protein n=1 Tax=Actinomycetospora rhizophila TaxID=1416876 RepID=A0ABV9Z906_9PSEU